MRSGDRLDERLVRGELGAVGQGDRHQVVELPGGVDQRDLEVIVLQRDDHRARVEPQDLGEVGALDAPLLPRRGRLLLEVGDHVPGPIDLDSRDQVPAQVRDPLDQVVPPLDAVEGAGIHSPVLVHQEVGVGRHEQGVVLGGLDVPVPGVQDLPRGQGLEDGIGQGDVLDQSAAAVEEVDAGRGHDALVEVRAAAVVSDIVEAHVERGNPEDLGPRELGLGHPDAGLRGGHDQRPGVGEPQGGGEVDRKPQVVRLQRCRLDLHELFFGY